MVLLSEIVQTFILADFCYYYVKRYVIKPLLSLLQRVKTSDANKWFLLVQCCWWTTCAAASFRGGVKSATGYTTQWFCL
jgi:hypothetical protein